MVFVTNSLTGWKLEGTWSEEEVELEAAPIFKRTFLVIAVALLVGAAIVFSIVRSIISPLRSLTDVSRKIGRGDLSQSAVSRQRTSSVCLRQALIK